MKIFLFILALLYLASVCNQLAKLSESPYRHYVPISKRERMAAIIGNGIVLFAITIFLVTR